MLNAFFFIQIIRTPKQIIPQKYVRYFLHFIVKTENYGHLNRDLVLVKRGKDNIFLPL